MRFGALIAVSLLTACAAQTPTSTTHANLAAADAATTLIVGEAISMTREEYASREGSDPLVVLTLRHADGRTMRFNEANHAPTHVMAQAPGGPLAQTMGLFGEESPVLFSAREDEHEGAPFICGPDGPVSIGLYEASEGAVQIVGLRQQFSFETLPDGSTTPLPYSPDQVCARLSLRRY